MEANPPSSVYTDLGVPELSLVATAIILFFCLPSVAMLGYWSGRSRRARSLAQNKEIDVVLGETTLGAILDLLGLLLAFTYGNGLAKSQAAQTTLIDEAVAFGTAFARADYLSEPGRTELKTAILDYARTRIIPEATALNSEEKTREFLNRTLAAQAKIWPLTIAATADPVPTQMQVHVSSAVNELLDAHHYRMHTSVASLSEYTQGLLLFNAMAVLFLLGNRSGILGRQLTWRTFFLSGFLFVVVVAIADTQRTSEGLIRIDQGALLVTIADMEASLRLAN